DIEEKQRMLKDRVLLIGRNLIEMKESADDSIISLKKDVELFKQEMARLKGTISRISEEFDSFARKSEIEMLQRQIKMFEPLRYARIEDVENMIKEALEKEKPKS
ncbi:MAG TPA: hypothetical protein VJA86_00895, partial [Candidatus Nanoarchaeia archaeon]|nr:hypothetical protein [Candidatus Nanoarchaeia archaeon]